MDKDENFIVYLNEAGINYVRYDPEHKNLFIRYHNPETNPKVVSLIDMTDWNKFCKKPSFCILQYICLDHKIQEIKAMAPFSA